VRIVLTNDDGIDAPGLLAARVALEKVADVLTVAPDQNRSGVGRSGQGFYRPVPDRGNAAPVADREERRQAMLDPRLPCPRNDLRPDSGGIAERHGKRERRQR